MTWLAIAIPERRNVALAVNFTPSLLRQLRYCAIRGGDVHGEMRFIEHTGAHPVEALEKEPAYITLTADPFLSPRFIARGDEDWNDNDVPEGEVELALRGDGPGVVDTYELELGSLADVMRIAGFENHLNASVFEVRLETTRSVTTRLTLNVACEQGRSPSVTELHAALSGNIPNRLLPDEEVADTYTPTALRILSASRLEAGEREGSIYLRLPPKKKK